MYIWLASSVAHVQRTHSLAKRHFNDYSLCSLVKALKKMVQNLILNTIVFNFRGSMVLIYQTLSESYDTITIINWLIK